MEDFCIYADESRAPNHIAYLAYELKFAVDKICNDKYVDRVIDCSAINALENIQREAIENLNRVCFGDYVPELRMGNFNRVSRVSNASFYYLRTLATKDVLLVKECNEAICSNIYRLRLISDYQEYLEEDEENPIDLQAYQR